MRGDFDTAAVLIGIAMVLDTLDGFFARLTRSTSAFGVELDSLADVVSFGLAPPCWRSRGGCGRSDASDGRRASSTSPPRRCVWRDSTSRRARSPTSGISSGMPSPAAAAVIASTVYLYPWGLHDPRAAAPALAMVIVPAFLMVSTIRFRSIKAIDVGWRRSPSCCSSAGSRLR